MGGKEVPGSGGRIAAYVSNLYSNGFSESLGDVKEGLPLSHNLTELP